MSKEKSVKPRHRQHGARKPTRLQRTEEAEQARLAPSIRRGLRRPRKRPSGRPFAKGNTFGQAFRFRPGVSGNPRGRPKYAYSLQAARAMLAAMVPGDEFERTFTEAIVQALGWRALAGDRQCAAELFDRAEGRPRQSVEVEQDDDPLIAILEELTARSEREDRREGFTLRKPEGEEDR